MNRQISAASAAELARSAFRRLAMLRLAPTPENYARIWVELEHAQGAVPQDGTASPPHAAPPHAAPVTQPGGAQPRQAGQAVPVVWRQMWEQSLHLGLIPACGDDSLRQRAGQLLALAQEAEQAQLLLGDNRELWGQFQALVTHEREATDGVLDLFSSVVAHLGEVFAADSAAAAEFGTLQQVTRRPLDGARIELARSVIEPWLRRQAALQRSALDARATSREVVGAIARSLATFAGHSEQFNDSLRVDLQRLQQGMDGAQLEALAQQLLQRGTALHGQCGELGEHLRQAQQQAEQAMHRIRRLESELQQASQQLQEDPLTGALNRRGLDMAFARDSVRALQTERPLAAALLDLDHFKQINDSYGHDFGDEVLRALVQVTRKLVRPGDTIARMGGEEFMVLFPETDAHAAQRVVQRLLQGFRNRRLLHRSTGQRVELSFSAGVAQCLAGEGFDSLYERADAALRQAKQNGRQQVFLAGS